MGLSRSGLLSRRKHDEDEDGRAREQKSDGFAVPPGAPADDDDSVVQPTGASTECYPFAGDGALWSWPTPPDSPLHPTDDCSEMHPFPVAGERTIAEHHPPPSAEATPHLQSVDGALVAAYAALDQHSASPAGSPSRPSEALLQLSPARTALEPCFDAPWHISPADTTLSRPSEAPRQLERGTSACRSDASKASPHERPMGDSSTRSVAASTAHTCDSSASRKVLLEERRQLLETRIAQLRAAKADERGVANAEADEPMADVRATKSHAVPVVPSLRFKLGAGKSPSLRSVEGSSALSSQAPCDATLLRSARQIPSAPTKEGPSGWICGRTASGEPCDAQSARSAGGTSNASSLASKRALLEDRRRSLLARKEQQAKRDESACAHGGAVGKQRKTAAPMPASVLSRSEQQRVPPSSLVHEVISEITTVGTPEADLPVEGVREVPSKASKESPPSQAHSMCSSSPATRRPPNPLRLRSPRTPARLVRRSSTSSDPEASSGEDSPAMLRENRRRVLAERRKRLEAARAVHNATEVVGDASGDSWRSVRV
jgi:hypothetical protein